MIELHVVPSGLHDLVCIPFLDTQEAPDHEMVVAIDGLCMVEEFQNMLKCVVNGA